MKIVIKAQNKTFVIPYMSRFSLMKWKKILQQLIKILFDQSNTRFIIYRRHFNVIELKTDIKTAKHTNAILLKPHVQML